MRTAESCSTRSNLSEGDVKTSMQGEYENAAKDINI